MKIKAILVVMVLLIVFSGIAFAQTQDRSQTLFLGIDQGVEVVCTSDRLLLDRVNEQVVVLKCLGGNMPTR